MRTHKSMLLSLALTLPLLSGCDLIYEALDIPNPSAQEDEARLAEREARAIGSACRHAGRSLEDCYTLNPDARKAWIFDGWQEMNDYMDMNEMQIVPSELPHPGLNQQSGTDAQSEEQAGSETGSAESIFGQG